jgi:hypothetical protein
MSHDPISAMPPAKSHRSGWPGWTVPVVAAMAVLALAVAALAIVEATRPIPTFPVAAATTNAASAPAGFEEQACSAMALALRNGTAYDPHTMATIAALAEQSSSDDIRTQGHLLGLSAQQAVQGPSSADLAQSAQDFEARCQANGL